MLIDSKILSSTSILTSEVSDINKVYITKTSHLTADTNFLRGVQKNIVSAEYPANGTFYYKGQFNLNATGSVSALYEYLRGYLYRDDDDPSVSALPTTITGKTANTTLTGFRMIIFTNDIKKDKIRPTSFKMSVTPVNISNTSSNSLFLSNSGIVDNTTTGKFTAITNVTSLSGSLLNGVKGSTLTAFTILMKIKPIPGGAPTQTLFHRRLGDKSSTSLGIGVSYPGVGNGLVMYKYGDLKPLSLEMAVSGLLDGSPTSFQTSLYHDGNYLNYMDYGRPVVLYDKLWLTAFFNNATNKLCSSTSTTASPMSSVVFTIWNKGGGTLRMKVYNGSYDIDRGDGYKTFLMVSTGDNKYYSLHDTSLKFNIPSYSNTSSWTASLTATFDDKSLAAPLSLVTPTADWMCYYQANIWRRYTWYIIFSHNSEDFRDVDQDTFGKQLFRIPITLTVKSVQYLG